ncbi:STM2901 family protein [Burkholderia sp. SIMBA_062]|uniref:STM2901 family protein n=1 Tax=Burkholderia sp. SIMBA_062 TaxID=3085803 RepID=UPI0039786AD4
MNNTYDFGAHRDLTPMELFFLVFIDETCKELGVDDVAAVVAIAAGQNWMPTRAKPFGTTPGTSVASILSRKYLDYDLKKKILPTLTNASVKRLRFILVRNIGVFVGRAVPVVGWVIAANNVTMISIRSVSRYNALVKPEDKVF